VTWWLWGDDEHCDKRFNEAGTHAMGLYVRAGSWCMGKVRYRPEREIPAEWFVPDDQVKAWCGSVRQANRLVDVGLWYRARGGYGFAWIRTENTADTLRAKRAAERKKWEARKKLRRGGIGGSLQ